MLLIFLIGSGVRYGGANHTPQLATSCQTPGLAVSATDIVRGHPLYVAVTGPDRAVVVAIDVATLSPDLAAVPLPGASEPQVIRPPVVISGCKGKGVLGVQVPAGTHTVSVFPAGGGGPLVSKPLTVTDH
ncbi:MAG: hypothetical protein NVSMB55_10920 [Mycobacteriales bacterium]